jgi:hypothetical protein
MLLFLKSFGENIEKGLYTPAIGCKLTREIEKRTLHLS